MAANQQTRNRTLHLCQFCLKTVYSLSTHLRNSCAKGSSESEIRSLVDIAKKDSQSHLRYGRIWEFSELFYMMEQPDCLNRLITELQKRGNVIKNLPAAGLPTTTRRSTITTPPPAAESLDSPQTAASQNSSEEYYQPPDTAQSYTSKRGKMLETGFYKKHSMDHPLLRSFKVYLKDERKKRKFKQEIDNVARFMYFMDPRQPSLKFVREQERIREYFRKLVENGLKTRTNQNYMKSIKRFLKFQTTHTNLFFDDRELHKVCMHCIEFIGGLQTVSNPQVNKEIISQRYSAFNESRITPRECMAVLVKAKYDFLAVLGKLSADPMERPTLQELQLVVYYLEAILILGHLQRPGVVTNLTVDEWSERRIVKDSYYVVAVKDHKTGANQIAHMSLTLEEETWFDMYFKKVRPIMLKRARKVKDVTKFFVSSTGKPIHNPSNDMKRLHNRYKLPKVNSQTARRAFETGTQHMSDAQKCLVANYLSHTSATANRHYRMREMENVVLGYQLLREIAGDTEPSSDDGQGQTTPSCSRMSEQDTCDLFMRTHPATIDGDAPEHSIRVALAGEWARKCYNLWRSEQKRLRVKCILEHFGLRRPSEKKVNKFLAQKDWTLNVPNARQVCIRWKPPAGVECALDSRNVKKVVQKQKWSGLQVISKAISTTREFTCGEVVCDFHGKLLSKEEGLAKVNADTAGCLFFFEDQRGSGKCIDACKERCDCHSDKDTLGRLIKHSSKRANVRPRLYHTTDGHEVILFLATKDIGRGEELLYDHGDKRKVYVGEGLNLHWS